jgi:GNAT superfamily N-acetyltransferase
MEIRPIQDSDDHARAGALVQAAYRMLPEYPADDDYDAFLGDVGARRNDADVIVAVVDGEIVGCLTFVQGPGTDHHEFADPESASFRYFGVDPAAQGKGVGHAMVRWCLDESARIGRRRVRIHTLTMMERAQRLYEQMGFVRTPDLDEDWDGIIGLAYVCELDGLVPSNPTTGGTPLDA